MDALDDIVNAVSDVILVFEKAQSDPYTDIVINAKNMDILAKSIDQMSQDVRKNCEQVKDAHLRGQLDGAVSEVTNACNRLTNVIKQQPNNVISRTAYGDLHTELRNILNGLLTELKVTDQVNVAVLLETVKYNLDIFIRLKQCDNINGLVAIARDASKFGLTLQIQIKSRLAEMTDPDLKSRLSDANEVVTENTPNCVSACQAAVQDPSSFNLENKEKYLKKVIVALQEMVTVIQISAKYISDYALQFMLPSQKFKDAEPSDYTRNPRVSVELAKLEDAVRRKNAADASKAAQNFVKEAQKQIELSKAFLATVKNPAKRAALARDIEELEKLLPQIVALTKEALKGDPEAVRKLNELIQRAREINRRLEDARKPEIEVLQSAHNVNQALDNINRAAELLAQGKISPDVLVEEAKNLADRIKKHVAFAREAAENVKDPKLKQAILDAIEELEKLTPQIIQLIKELVANPSDANARRKLAQLIDQAKNATDKISKALLEDQLQQNREALNKQLDKLYEAVKKGDEASATEYSKDIADLLSRRIELGKELAHVEKNPELQNQIMQGTSALERLAPELVIATKNALTNKDDPSLQNLGRVIDDIKNASEAVTSQKKVPLNFYSSKSNGKGNSVPPQNVETTAEEAFINGQNLEENLQRLKKAVDTGNAPETSSAARDVANSVATQVALANKLAQSTNDPNTKKKLKDAASNLDNLLPKIITGAKDALSNPNDKNIRENFHQLIDQASKENRNIMEIADDMRPQDKKFGDIAADFRNKTKLVEKEPSVKADPNKDPLMFAAQMVSEASRDSAKKSAPIPEQKNLLSIADGIAEQMELLAKAAAVNNKADMIEIARTLATMITQIQTFASEIANKCTDPTLKAQLLSICRVPKNFAVQLKIIAAVKATGKDNDPTAALQLVTCAKGLANSVVQTVKASEAASLKCPRT